MPFPSGSRPVSVQDIRQFTARETSNARKVVAATKIARWYRNAQLEKGARTRASIQKAYYRGLIRMIFMLWLRYFRVLRASKRRIYRYTFDQWRAPLKETITSLRHYERKLVARAFFLWRTDPGSRVGYIELLTGDKAPAPYITQHLRMLRIRSILLFWRARQVLLKCLNIGLELTVSIGVVANKVPQSSSSSTWQGYLCYLNSLDSRESSVSSRLSEKLLRHSFISWKHKAITILRESKLALKLREMELRRLRPFLKSWILLHRVRPYIVERAIFRWQLTLSVHIRRVEVAKAAIELRKYTIKRSHFNNWTRYLFARELLARYHCLEKVYGTTSSILEGSFVCSSWLKYALFFIHSLLSKYRLQATAFRCLRKLKDAVSAPKYWRRLIVLAHGTYYISRLRLYLRAWAFVAFKMKTVERRQRSFCATDDIVFQSADIKILHDKHNDELTCHESLLLMGLISKNSGIQPHRLAVLCKADKHNCLLLMKLRRHISHQSDQAIAALYNGVCGTDAIARVDRLLLRCAIVAMTNLSAYNMCYIETSQAVRTLNLEDPTQYRQAMGLVQRNLAVRYHEFLAATDLLYSELYTSGTQSPSERKIIAYISGKFPHIKNTLTTESVVLLTTAFLLETPAIMFTDRRSVISSSFLIQTWMGNKQSHASQHKEQPCGEGLHHPFIPVSVSIVDNVYFTGLSRDFNAKGVAMLLPPNISPADRSITATERASLWTQLEALKRRRFSVSTEAECWLLGAIASASERELQLSALSRKKLYLKQASRPLVSSIRRPPLRPASQEDDVSSVCDVEVEPLDVMQLFQHARSIQMDRFTTTMISADATRVTVDEMKRLIETVRTSVVHPSLLTYINAEVPKKEATTTVEIAVPIEPANLTRSLDDLFELETTATATTMRIIERSFSIAPLSQVTAGSFCMLPDEQLINSSDLSLMQSSQLLSRHNSYVSPSFEQYSRTTGQSIKPSGSAKKAIHSDKLLHASPRKKSRSKSGSSSKRNAARQRKQEAVQPAHKLGHNRASKTARHPNKQQLEVCTATEGEHSVYSDTSTTSCIALSTDSFYIHALDDFHDDSPRCTTTQTPRHALYNKGTAEQVSNLRPHSSYYSSMADGRLSSGRAFLGQLSSRPQTTAPYITRRMNNSQRSSDTESSDDIKLQEQHRADSATSHRSHTKQKREVSNTRANSSMATAVPTTTCSDTALPTKQFISAQLASGHFTLGFLTRYQKALLALRIWRRSSHCPAYILSESTSFPGTDISLYALSTGRMVSSLDTLIDTILYDNIMRLYDNEDPDEVFREIWLTDPQFTDASMLENTIPAPTLARLHFNKFWDYARALSDEYIYELGYEGDHALGDKIMRPVHSAPVLYGRMLRCSLVEAANLTNTVAGGTASSLVYRTPFLSSARSRSGTAVFSQMTLDDLHIDFAHKQTARFNRLPMKPTTASSCAFLPGTQRKSLSELTARKASSSRLSPRVVYSVVSMSLCDDKLVTISVSSPRPWSSENPDYPNDSLADATTLHPGSQPHGWTHGGRLSYTPKMAHLTTDVGVASLPSASCYLRSGSVPLKMAVPQPLGQLIIDESLLTVKAELEPPMATQGIKPFLISSSVNGRFTTTIHKMNEIKPTSARRLHSGKIGGLAYSESREVLLSRPTSKSTVDKTPLLSGTLLDNKGDSLTSLDDDLETELRSATNSAKTSLDSTIEEGVETVQSNKEQGSFKYLHNGLLVQGWGNACLTGQKKSEICGGNDHLRATSSPQFGSRIGSPNQNKKRIVKIGSTYPSIASLAEAPDKTKCLDILSAHENAHMYEQVHTYQPRVSKSVQRDRSPKRPSSGLKVFCSSAQVPGYTVNEIDYIRKHNQILTERANSLPLQDQLAEKIGPAILQLSAPVSNQEDFGNLDLPLGDINEAYEHVDQPDSLVRVKIDPNDSFDALGRDTYGSTELGPISESIYIISNQVTGSTTTEVPSPRYSPMREQIREILSRGSSRLTHNTAYASRKDQVVLNAKQDYKQCLFNKSTNFEQRTFNSILHPREIDKKYEEVRERLKSRVGSRAPSRLSSRGHFCPDKSPSPLRPLRTSPGRRRENLLVITMDPPTQIETTTDEIESTDIGIRINERLFGIDHVC